jgi:hypothetical protein
MKLLGGSKLDSSLRIKSTRPTMGLRHIDREPKPRFNVRAARAAIAKGKGDYYLHPLRIPMLSHEVWSSLAVSIKKQVEEYSRDKSVSNPYFDAYRGLQLDSNDSTVDAIVNKLVYWLQMYHYTWMQVVTRVMNLMSFEQLTGSDIAMRERIENKFSKIASYFTGKMAFPIHKGMMDMLLNNNVFLGHVSVQKGHHIAVPYWLPIIEMDVGYRRDAGDLTNSFFATIKPRIPFFMDLNVSSDPGPMYPADTGSYANGSLGKYLYAELDAAVSLMKAQFDHNANEDRNIIHPNNLLLKMAIEEYGTLTNDMFRFREFAQMFRKQVKVVDYYEYMESFPGYLGEYQPVPASPLKEESDVGISLMGIPDSEADADYLTDLDTYYSGLAKDGNGMVTAAAIEAEARIPYGALMLTEAQTETFLNDGRLPDMGSTIFGSSVDAVQSANIDRDEGANQDDPTTVAHFNTEFGYYPKYKALYEWFGGEEVFEDAPGNLFNEIRDNGGLMAMSNDAIANGVLQPFWLVTPVKDVYDPYFHGVFPILSVEAVDVPGTWSKWFKDNLSSVTATASSENTAANEFAIGPVGTQFSGSANPFDDESESSFQYAKDMVGPFIGNGMGLDMDEYFMRLGLIEWDKYPSATWASPRNYLPCAVHVREDFELGAYDNPVIIGAAAGSLGGVTFASEGAAYNYANAATITDGVTTVASVAELVMQRVYARILNVLGRTPVRMLDMHYTMIKNVLDTFGGNSFGEFVGKMGPVPAAKAVSVAYSIQQFLDIAKKVGSREVKSMSVFGEQTGRGTSTSENKGKFRKKYSKRKPRKKKPFNKDKFSKAPLVPEEKSEPASEDLKSSTFGDKDKEDKVDFAHPDK